MSAQTTATTTTLPDGFAQDVADLLQRFQTRSSPVELVHVSHDRWPLAPAKNSVPDSRNNPRAHTPVRISILDSSFNPPTLAHLALANALPPDHPEDGAATDPDDYDARLLLLSVRNADKALKPGDATHAQRLEMMYLLARDVGRSAGSESKSKSKSKSESSSPRDVSTNNCAVAIIDEPTFVGKAGALLAFLSVRIASLTNPNLASPPLEGPSQADLRTEERARDLSTLPGSTRPQLTFLLGFDTLVRLIAPRYYASEEFMARALGGFFAPGPEGNDCRVVCARRAPVGQMATSVGDDTTAEAEAELERKVLEEAGRFVQPGRIAMVDIGADERTYSSSEVREKVGKGDVLWQKLVSRPVAEYIVERGLYAAL